MELRATTKKTCGRNDDHRGDTEVEFEPHSANQTYVTVRDVTCWSWIAVVLQGILNKANENAGDLRVSLICGAILHKTFRLISLKN